MYSVLGRILAVTINSVLHKKCSLVSFFIVIRFRHTHEQKPKTSLKLRPNSTGTGSPTTICAKLAQLTLRKGHNYADSQAHSQAVDSRLVEVLGVGIAE